MFFEKKKTLPWVSDYSPPRGFRRLSWTGKTAGGSENCGFALEFNPPPVVSGEFVGHVKPRGVYYFLHTLGKLAKREGGWLP